MPPVFGLVRAALDIDKYAARGIPKVEAGNLADYFVSAEKELKSLALACRTSGLAATVARDGGDGCDALPFVK
eukprot:14142114-Alexandrium_andersonii.AAC.1